MEYPLGYKGKMLQETCVTVPPEEQGNSTENVS